MHSLLIAIISNKEGRHSCRPALVMHTILISIPGFGRQECRPSLSSYIINYAIKKIVTRRGDTLVTQR